MQAVPLSWYLILSALLFAIGLFAALSRRNAVMVLIGIEIMMNSANINLVAFSRYLPDNRMTGWAFALFGIAIAAAEIAVGLALLLAIYRSARTIDVDRIKELKG